MRVRPILSIAAKSAATTIIFFLLAEAAVRTAYVVRNRFVTYVPLPYVVGDDYGPIPPWLDSELILQPDPRLIWRSTPNAHRKYVDIFSPVRRPADRIALLRRFNPVLPAAFRNNPVWEIALNADGDRSPDVTPARRPSTLRIACVGDSWTFGMNVNQDQTYPGRLGALLREARPSTTIEVMNFGVLGYSSFQGLQLVKARVLALNPDIVAIGFGMNDSEVAGYRDKDMIDTTPPPTLPRLGDLVERIEFYKLLRYAAVVMRYHPQSLADALTAEANWKGSGVVNYDEMEPWTRVSPQDYERNIREMIALARGRGARAVLLDNELWDGSPYRPVLRRISRDEGVPLVDSVEIIRDGKKKIETDLETQLGLAPTDQPGGAAPSLVDVVFRVRGGAFPVQTFMSIVGTHAQLGAVQPNTILMHDDGTGGDQRAGDGVWSYTATVPAGTRLFYVYTNSGTHGEWEGVDVPAIRQLLVKPTHGRRMYPPIETFGKIYMQADNWHTDASGYDLIARAVAAALR